ncbi:hypothetical protein HD554DRAFT_1146173 [Boletus coccyginus]|nr:hypothetical protein HD554DRAFT_1146173 [Boletus coccyginus]
MIANGIPLDKAALLSALLEALLYGFSLLMFGGTIWTLLSQRSTRPVNRKMFTVACLLLLISTTHLVINIIRVMYGLILYRDTYPGGPVAYFSDISQWTFNAKNYVYSAQTAVGDSVILYRCYKVWQSKLVMILPLLLWCATAVTGITSSTIAQHSTQIGVFGGALGRWITSFWATTLATNLLTSLLLIFRIWYVDRQFSRLGGHHRSQLRPILHILVDSGAIYSVTLVAALVCFVTESNGQYVVLDMVTPIISITFYMVIIRVGLATRTGQMTHVLLLGNTAIAMDNSTNTERRRRKKVHIPRLTERKTDHGQRSPTDISRPSINNYNLNEIKFDGEGEV